MSACPGLPLSPEAQAYAWRELARRAGLPAQPGAMHGFEALALQPHYAVPREDDPSGPAVYIPPCSPDAWEKIITAAPESLTWLPLRACLPPGVPSPLAEDVPVLFPALGFRAEQPLAEILPGGRLVFSVDLLAATVFFLTRWEEQAHPVLDVHGRFPGSASAGARLGFLDRPLVDEYALILRAWLQQLLPAWQPQPRRFTVSLTHDIDVLTLPFAKGLRLAAADVLKDRQPGLAWGTLLHLMEPSRGDPYLGGIDALVGLSKQHGFRSTFFFQATRPSKYDEGYDIAAPEARRVLRRLEAEGFEIGLHPAYATLDQPSDLPVEKARLDAQLSCPSTWARQHFLRVRLPDTWRLYSAAGFAYDASLTYSDQEGFRCGTCHPYPVFDLKANRLLPVEEHPLIIMDVTLRNYRHLTPDAAAERIVQLAQRCQRVGGDFTLLWHNSSFWHGWQPWPQVYASVLPRLKEMEQSASSALI